MIIFFKIPSHKKKKKKVQFCPHCIDMLERKKTKLSGTACIIQNMHHKRQHLLSLGLVKEVNIFASY